MLRPMNTYILATTRDYDEEYQSSIILPENITASADNLLEIGEVLAINSNCKEINVGDLILYNKYATIVDKENKDQFLVREEDVYACIIR